ncbi:MAG: serine/threonine protein kinase [Myxococcales bacterium]|nr:serine/threonine protein kinase [Myxococcales bacterium]
MEALLPGTTVGTYAVERLLGVGGCASVYLASHTTLGARFALKVVHSAHPRILPRLLREGRLQSSLRHPNIVSVFDVLEWEGLPVLVMDHVDGPSLHELLFLKTLDLDHLDRLALGIFRGVRAAHRAGLVHRDLKPANILLARTEGELVPKIGDFGLAKVLTDDGSGLTRAGQVFGTPGYMAPEQFRDARSVDARADLFAIGCILYEMIGQRPPYVGTDLIELYGRIGRGERTPLSELRSGVPPRMLEAVERCLLPDPQERIRDVDELFAVWFDDPTGEHTGSLPLVSSVPISVTDEELSSLRSRLSEEDEAAASESLSGGPDHLPPERIAATEPTAEEQAHLDACVRCRVDRLRLLSVVNTGGADAPPSLQTPIPPRAEETVILAPPDRRSGLTSVAPWALAGVALLVAGWLWWTGRPAPVERPLEPVVIAVPATVPTTPEPEPVAAKPVRATVTGVSRPRTTKTRPIPVPAPVEVVDEVVEDPPPAPLPASVTVGGNARSVFLIDAEGRKHHPGELVAGTYRVRVQFDLHGQIELDDPIDLAPGVHYDLHCFSAFANCQLSER